MASRFWVGGTGSWDAATTTNWSASSGGAGGASVPVAGDDVTFDSSSGGGTVTLNFGGTIAIKSLTIDSFAGTWTNAANNNNINFSGSSTAFSMVGSGVRTINLGTATYTLTGGTSTATYSVQGATNLTFTASSSNIVFASEASQRTVGLGNKSHGNITFGSSPSNDASFYTITNASAGPTVASLTINAPNWILWPTSALTTITAVVNWAGTYSAGIGFITPTNGLGASISVPLTSTGSYMSFHDITFSMAAATPHITVTNGIAGNNATNITFVGGGSGAGGEVFSAGFF